MRSFACSPQQDLVFERAAALTGRPVSDWIREALWQSAVATLNEAGEGLPDARTPPGPPPFV